MCTISCKICTHWWNINKSQGGTFMFTLYVEGTYKYIVHIRSTYLVFVHVCCSFDMKMRRSTNWWRVLELPSTRALLQTSRNESWPRTEVLYRATSDGYCKRTCRHVILSCLLIVKLAGVLLHDRVIERLVGIYDLQGIRYWHLQPTNSTTGCKQIIGQLVIFTQTET